ncbi:SDR family NAD(P)-dependent oxidoreductase [Streptomyces sp. NPDC001142]
MTRPEASGDRSGRLVNNAGVSLRNGALEATPEEFDTTLSVNLRGTYFTAQRAARAMRERGGGRIINLASIGGLVVDGERSSVYDASKAAVVQVTKNMAYEWGRYGIRVNAIAPGYMRTAMTTDLLPDRAEEDRLVDTHIPLGRIGEPGDLGGAVVFLFSERARLRSRPPVGPPDAPPASGPLSGRTGPGQGPTGRNGPGGRLTGVREPVRRPRSPRGARR